MHSFAHYLMHCVWATKERRPLIKPDLPQRLWPYLGDIRHGGNVNRYYSSAD